MRFINHRVLYSVAFYILTIMLIFISKPKIIFNQDETIKQFGIGHHKTLFSFGVFTVLLALISFYVFAVIDVLF